MDNMDLTVNCPRKVTKLIHTLTPYYVKPYNMNGVIFTGPTRLTFHFFFCVDLSVSFHELHISVMIYFLFAYRQ